MLDLYELGTFLHYSYLIANILHILDCLQLLTKNHFLTMPWHELDNHGPVFKNKFMVFILNMQSKLPTCKIVSKLKAVPFHNVNSPLEEPVTSLRPSGVHTT